MAERAARKPGRKTGSRFPLVASTDAQVRSRHQDGMCHGVHDVLPQA